MRENFGFVAETQKPRDSHKGHPRRLPKELAAKPPIRSGGVKPQATLGERDFPAFMSTPQRGWVASDATAVPL